MSKVKRYKLPDRVIADYLEMRMRTEGETEYVLASDYDALLKQVAPAAPVLVDKTVHYGELLETLDDLPLTGEDQVHVVVTGTVERSVRDS